MIMTLYYTGLTLVVIGISGALNAFNIGISPAWMAIGALLMIIANVVMWIEELRRR